ncbi:hypothetical protein B0T26DRAFT_869776 [Lasiosphaeria miniovina]|uniref:Uncharacterized protein n=1 Tax=Lasiosphaeria miniovina TaxID=1954250 RepID=A0AA40E6H9_9PEZI|nr:uncharacterized protein B0T26DRAFT_869776 [Lasiosphaeria miniovina]KAK0728810.1 hypothetical protein B0T26DRAFT_869776 [Lasiosphaeria miniovina]
MANFSRHKFTFWSGRLPALAGLVQHYQAATGDTPILGMWQRSLILDVFWRRSPSRALDITMQHFTLEIRNPGHPDAATPELQIVAWYVFDAPEKGAAALRAAGVAFLLLEQVTYD